MIRILTSGQKKQIEATLQQLNQVSEEKKTLLKSNESLSTLTKQFEQVFEKSPWGLLIVNNDQSLIHINEAARKIELNTPQIKKLTAKALKGVPVKQNIQFPHNNRIIEVQTFPLYDQDNNISGCFATLQDTTKIAALADVKKDFIANVSHDLRTPIASIKSLTEALIAGAKDDPQRLDSFLQELDKQSERLSNLVQDILDLSKIENKETLTLKKLDIKPLLEQSINVSKHQAEIKNIKVELKTSPSLQANADAEQLMKAFNNLLDNSIKYTPQSGSILITATTNNGQIKISFKDTGIGIPQKDLPRIFERFYRVSKSRSIETGGTGLGLSIVKHVIENHGGKIKVKSQLNKGSEFILYLML